MGLRSSQLSPLAIAGIGSAIIAVLIGTALHPPSGSSESTFSSPSTGVVVVADPVAVICPDVVSEVPVVPAAVQTKVTEEVDGLRRDIANVNLRLARSPEQAVDRLNIIVAERKSAIERIIREVTEAGGNEPAGLRDLAECAVRRAPTGVTEATSTIGIDDTAEQDKGDKAEDGATKTPVATPTESSADDADEGQADADQTDEPAENNDGGETGEEADDDGVPTVSCPAVASRLGNVPDAAADEVDQNLAELQQQIAEANASLALLAANPVSDPNFVENTILGPLRNRRIATLDRITIAIGRVTTPPSNLAALAPCFVKA